MKNTRLNTLKYAAAPLAIGLALASAPAYAQDAEEDSASAPIIVTGSRIARTTDTETASPVTVVGSEQVELTGTTTVETLLNELPMVIPGNTRVSNNSGGENFSTLDLRGLGPGRTLILLDGERLPASTTSGVTDISQIPTGLIDRIEVVTGGASAVYGSDALAGVINFILKDDFEGVELTAQNSISQDGTGFGMNVSGMVGGNFADDKGNITVYGSFTNRSSVSQGRYDYSRTSAAVYLPYDVANCDDRVIDCQYGIPYVVDDPSDLQNTPGFQQIAVSPGGSLTPPWGFINNSGTNPFQNLGTLLPGNFGAGNYDTNCDGVANTAPYNTGNIAFGDDGALIPRAAAGNCNIPLRSIGSSRYNFGPENYLITPYDRLTFTAVGNYNFTEDTRLKVYASYTNANQQVALAPTPAGASTAITVPANSPLIPADLAAALASRPNPNAPFILNRRFSETGPRIGDFTTDSKSIRAIVEHNLSDRWSMSVVGSFGRVDNKIRNTGNIRRSAVEQGLNGCPLGSPANCVPVDLFGPNTLTPAMLSFVALTTTDTESFEQLRVAANVTGSLFDLPGGPVGVAFGVEYRKDTGESYVDDAKRTGDIIGFNAQADVAGSINVKEVYGEVRLPITSFFTVGAGARYSDYSTLGGLFNWKAEAEFTPADFIKVRGSYNRAARAPNVFELFQNGDQGFVTYTDPCNQTNSGRDETFCVSQGVPIAAINGFAQGNTQVETLAFGNQDLSEEKGETWTLGVVLQPGDFLGGNLTVTADYYNIKLTNRVAGLGATFFIGQCYTNNDPAACARVVRNTDTGQIDFVSTTITNSTTPLVTSGVDVGVDWRVPAFGGQLYLQNTLTYVDSYKLGDSELVDTAFSGNGGVTPQWANTATVGWSGDDITFQVRYVWKRGGKQNFPGADFDGLYPFDEVLNPDTGEIEAVPLYDEFPDRIPDLHLINASVRFDVTEGFELTAIVNNILDKYPPQTTTGTFEQANTNINFYDPYALGRNFTIQGRIKF